MAQTARPNGDPRPHDDLWDEREQAAGTLNGLLLIVGQRLASEDAIRIGG